MNNFLRYYLVPVLIFAVVFITLSGLGVEALHKYAASFLAQITAILLLITGED